MKARWLLRCLVVCWAVCGAGCASREPIAVSQSETVWIGLGGREFPETSPADPQMNAFITQLSQIAGAAYRRADVRPPVAYRVDAHVVFDPKRRIHVREFKGTRSPTIAVIAQKAIEEAYEKTVIPDSVYPIFSKIEVVTFMF